MLFECKNDELPTPEEYVMEYNFRVMTGLILARIKPTPKV
jgi:hypothetical protein